MDAKGRFAALNVDGGAVNRQSSVVNIKIVFGALVINENHVAELSEADFFGWFYGKRLVIDADCTVNGDFCGGGVARCEGEKNGGTDGGEKQRGLLRAYAGGWYAFDFLEVFPSGKRDRNNGSKYRHPGFRSFSIESLENSSFV